MKKLLEDVRDFHDAMNVPTRTVGDYEASSERWYLRAELIREEADETAEALAARDLTETADGLADLIYVAVGTALELGIDLEAVWNEVHRSNMAKRGGPVRASGKVLKPEGWTPPQIASVLASSAQNGKKGTR